MRKRSVRIIAILIAVLSVAAAFSGCGPAKDPANTTAAQTTPKVLDFKGREFVISSAWSEDWIARPEESQHEREKQDIYDKIEKDLNIKIVFSDKEGFANFEGIMPMIIAGDVPSDMADQKLHTWIPCAVNKYILPMDDARVIAGGLNYTDPAHFFQPYTTAMSLGDKVYGLQWNGSYSVCEFGWCIYFNKELVEEAGVTDLYKVVRDGNWDWNYFLDLAKKITKDTDGDNIIDQWGIGTFGYGTELLTKQGAEIIRLGDDGKFKVVVDEPAAIESLDFTYRFAYQEKVLHPEGYGGVHNSFNMNGDVGLCWGEFWNTRADDLGFKTSSISYGLVPMPKAPGNDKYVNVLGGVRANTMWSMNPNIEDVAAIVSVFGERFTDDNWQQTYCTNMLQGDEEALEMVLDYIWPNTVLDYVWASESILNNFRENIYLPMTEGQGTPKALVEQHKAALQAEVDRVFKQN